MCAFLIFYMYYRILSDDWRTASTV